MGMCAIYTAIPPPQSAEELTAIAKQNESKAYGARRCTLGRAAVAELVTQIVPPSHAALAKTIAERDLWGFLTPAAARGNHASTLHRMHPDLPVSVPLWPYSIELACLVGAEPAHYVGNNLVMLGPNLVSHAVAAFDARAATSEPAAYLLEYLAPTVPRGEAVLLHWDYR
jgi:hypothetical protein